ncbi:Uncharacterised protein [Klebsiella variicola]|nr:Uncharacterised protein [Klebsiella variicola]
MMSLWDALRMNMMISYQELVRTFLSTERLDTLSVLIKNPPFGVINNLHIIIPFFYKFLNSKNNFPHLSPSPRSTLSPTHSSTPKSFLF